jgi:hypothetical protein
MVMGKTLMAIEKIESFVASWDGVASTLKNNEKTKLTLP